MTEEALWARLPFALGDVLVAEGGDEAWLAGASLFFEDALVAALFRAPGSGVDRAVYLRAVPPLDAFWLEAKPAERGPREPPSSLEQEGTLYTRVRRLPVRIERRGESSFDLEGLAILGEYRGLGAQRLVRVATSEAVLTCVGRVLLPGTYDRLPASS